MERALYQSNSTPPQTKRKIQRLGYFQNILNFKRLHAVAKRIHKIAKRTAWRNYVSTITHSTSTKEIWGVIKSFSGFKKTTNSPIFINGNFVFNITEKAETQAVYFKSNMYRVDVFNYSREDISLIDISANSFQEEKYNNRLSLGELNAAIKSLKKQKILRGR